MITSKKIILISKPLTHRWVLRLEDTQVKDEGTYECQVTTAIKTSSLVYLKVLGKYDSYTIIPDIW